MMTAETEKSTAIAESVLDQDPEGVNVCHHAGTMSAQPGGTSGTTERGREAADRSRNLQLS